VAKPGGAPLLVLASASPRRARILQELGVSFTVKPANVDESLLPGEDGSTAVERLARAKAFAVSENESLPVLAADTIVLCDGDALGKPADEAEARAMLRRLSGRTHEVVTGVCLVGRDQAYSGVERTQVTLAPLTDDEVAWYVATGEPLDKAGAYNIAGKGALFIEEIHGSPSNVAGLPVHLLLQLVRASGLDLTWPQS
jgi:septum formation protein